MLPDISGVAGLYSLSPVVFDAPVCATGVGWDIGIGRIGSILSPTVARFYSMAAGSR